MRTRHRGILAAGLTIALVAGSSLASTAQDRGALSFAELDEVRALTQLADDVADGELPGGDAWLKLNHHLLRGGNGRVYVPFTVTIDEAPGRFGSVSLYIRAANQGEDSSAGKERAERQRLVGFELGQLPVFVPERATAATADGATFLAGEASTALRLAGDTAVDEARYPFEDVHFIDFSEAADDDGGREPYRVRRALAVAPGTYDIYVAVREYSLSGNHPDDRGSAVIKRTLSIPPISPVDLALSSIILADELRLLDRPLPSEKQPTRPYVFGGTEIVPAPDPLLSRAETLAVAFFIYNLHSDADGKPNATVRYRLHQQAPAGEEFIGETAPTEFTPETLPQGFDYEAAGRQLFASQMLPLGNFSEGGYRLEVIVSDNLAEHSTARSLQFIIQPGAPDL
tara:strand:+ start:1483 stop:2682 length:1200 start_codon:yes stop_codon:yes gene_type:complete